MYEMKFSVNFIIFVTVFDDYYYYCRCYSKGRMSFIVEQNYLGLSYPFKSVVNGFKGILVYSMKQQIIVRVDFVIFLCVD